MTVIIDVGGGLVDSEGNIDFISLNRQNNQTENRSVSEMLY